MAKSLTQKVVTLSVTEAELHAATSCAQDMLFVWRMMQAMQLRVKLPMIHYNAIIRVQSTYPKIVVREA